MAIDSDPDALLPLTTVAFEILLSLAGGERHGYDIMVSIEERTNGRLSPNPGTLYRAVARLSKEGLLESTDRRTASGDRRRFFRLSALGARVAKAEARRLADQVRAARARRLLTPAGDA
jgi:DNA-binding PadR family transcriptional regulator